MTDKMNHTPPHHTPPHHTPPRRESPQSDSYSDSPQSDAGRGELPKLWRFGWVLVLIVCALAFVPGQHTIPPIDRDEARFAQASKQMLQSGDIITPRFQDDLRAKKPVGIYWLQAASAAVLGADNIAAYRLPSLFGGVLVCLLGFWLARQILPPREATLAVLMMAGSLVLAAEAHLAKTDAMLAAVCLAQQALLWRIFTTARGGDHVSGWLALGFWASMAAGILIKGPIAPLIAATTALTISIGGSIGGGIGGRGWHWLWGMRPVLGFITMTVLVLPWVVLVTHATDGAFLSTAIKGDLITKLQSGQESHGAPPLTHLALVIVVFWPGSLLLGRAARCLKGRWREPHILFLLGWVVPFWVLIESTPTKLPHYMLPVMPGLAMLAAFGAGASLAPPKASMKDIPENRPRESAYPPGHSGRRIITFIKVAIRAAIRAIRGRPLSTLLIHLWEAAFIAVSLALGVVVLAAATFYGGERIWGFAALLLALGVGGVAGVWMRRPRAWLLALMMLLAAGFHGVTFGLVLPSLADMHLAPRLKAAIEALAPPPEIIAAAGYHEPSLVFALGTETLLFTPTDAALFLSEAPGGIALIESRVRDDFITTLAAAGRKAEVVAVVEGYNISRGQRVRIEFFRPSD